MVYLGLLITVWAFMGAVMAASWITQRRTGDAGWTDAFWSFGVGVSLALSALYPLSPGAPPTARQWLVATLVGLWGLRLGGYITGRLLRSAEEDPRYAQFRREWGKSFQGRIFSFAQVQAPVGALLAIATLLAARHPEPGLRPADLLGLSIFVAALAGESLADAQMKAFRADPANRGRVADTGLWAWSRHPNYFFEWLVWLAYPVIAFDPARPWTLAALIAPALMYLLLTRVSGVPPLEAAMLRSRGGAYRAYQARTSAFFPLPPRKRQEIDA